MKSRHKILKLKWVKSSFRCKKRKMRIHQSMLKEGTFKCQCLKTTDMKMILISKSFRRTSFREGDPFSMARLTSLCHQLIKKLIDRRRSQHFRKGRHVSLIPALESKMKLRFSSDRRWFWIAIPKVTLRSKSWSEFSVIFLSYQQEAEIVKAPTQCI